MQLIPDMATDLGRPNEDNTEWTFTLREGLKYEDGSDVTAEDVAYAVKRSFAIEELPDGPTYQTTFFLDGDKYKGPFQDGGDYAGVEVTTATTSPSRCVVRSPTWTTTRPSRPSPRSREAKDNPETYGQKPLATGPYKFADYKAGSEPQPGQERPVGPEHRPGSHPDGRRLGVQVRSGHRQARERHHQRQRLGADDADLRQRERRRRTVDLPGQGASGHRHPAVHVHVVHRHDQDQGPQGPPGDRLRLPLRGCLEGRRRDRRRHPGPRHLHPSARHRRSQGVRRAGHRWREHRPGEGEGAAEEGRRREGYEIKFLFATDDDQSVAAKDAIVKGLEAGGFKATPIASTLETIRTDRTDYNSPINVRSSGWCSDWPSGGSWFPAQWAGELVGLEGMPNPANFKVTEVRRRAGPHPRHPDPRGGRSRPGASSTR